MAQNDDAPQRRCATARAEELRNIRQQIDNGETALTFWRLAFGNKMFTSNIRSLLIVGF